ncbi:hypothetical protein [Thalassobacillus pellis]|uniref:hypothetical protein n=1 Tax=Thalassobacillus pellis TaxID=748008 RepID=UPI001EF7DD90|nr:hypothetical protein [Thalassobacillus pellis]MBM7553266.1 hypothetical protein [Thalassobacillus pellis]
MLKKFTLLTLSVVMLFSFMIPSTSFAENIEPNVDAIEDMELTPEEQKRADELWEQYVAINTILENLNEEEQERFLDALLNPNFDPSKFKDNVSLAKGTQEVKNLDYMFEVLGSSVQFSSDVELLR